MIKNIKFDIIGYTVDLDLKSTLVLVGSSESGTGKSFLYEKLYKQMKFSGVDVLGINYKNMSKFNDVLNLKSDVILVDNLELLSKNDIDTLVKDGRQIIMFGRLNFNYTLGARNRANLHVKGDRIFLTYPFLDEE